MHPAGLGHLTGPVTKTPHCRVSHSPLRGCAQGKLIHALFLILLGWGGLRHSPLDQAPCRSPAPLPLNLFLHLCWYLGLLVGVLLLVCFETRSFLVAQARLEFSNLLLQPPKPGL